MIIQLKNVRLAFPHLFTAQPPQNGGTGAPKFNCALLMEPTHPGRKLVNDGMVAVGKEKWGAKADAILKSIAANNGLCLKNGDAKAEYEGYPGNFFMNASSKTRPTVIDGNKAPLTEADGKPYAGCYVNASIELWAQDNSFGKKINAGLRGIQFVRDGDAFAGGSSAADADEFDLAEGADAEGALV